MRRLRAERVRGWWKRTPRVAEVVWERRGGAVFWQGTLRRLPPLSALEMLFGSSEEQSQVVPRASRPDRVWGFFVLFFIFILFYSILFYIFRRFL